MVAAAADPTTAGQLRPVKTILDRIPSRTGQVTAKVVLRWIRDGAKAPNGRTVRLRAVRLPSAGWCVTDAWIEEFLGKLMNDAA